MGNKSADAYDIGVGLGFASFQSSVGQQDLAWAALESAQPSVHSLVVTYHLLDQNLLDSIYGPNPTALAHLVQVRQDVETNLRDHSNDAANAYRLGLLVALAEGQSTSGDWLASYALAHDALQQANSLIQGYLKNVPFDNNLMTKSLYYTNSPQRAPGDAHSFISMMRISYREQVLLSNLP
ncbi:MAG TPA: hypothetical protein VG097_02480 [Gemmata sp.]|jgi:hypothetical protein|nr:hypothetical protein [Gemmata sp.]